jgi:hypothetical protein
VTGRADREPLHPGRVRAFGVAAGAAVALVVVAVLGLTHSSGSGAAPTTKRRPLPPPVSAAGLAQKAGVRVVRVAATGAGGLLDLRYQVVDPDVAAAVHDPDTPPAIVDERSGLVLGQLLMGHMHNGRAKAGVTYPLVFINPGDAVRRGDRVSVVLGGARIEHLRVL